MADDSSRIKSPSFKAGTCETDVKKGKKKEEEKQKRSYLAQRIDGQKLGGLKVGYCFKRELVLQLVGINKQADGLETKKGGKTKKKASKKTVHFPAGRRESNKE
jgi:hypothetical protein